MAAMRLAPLALAAALLLAPAAARADDAPPTGTALIGVGSLLLVGGAVSTGTLALCPTTVTVPGGVGALSRATVWPAGCVGLSVGFAAAMLGAGIPLVVVGAKQRAAWLSWSVAPSQGGATASVGGRF